MIEVVPVRGPLDDTRLGWLCELYGAVDAKYASLDYVRHQFVDNPFGWSVHTFAMSDGGAVGHCAVVPFRARIGDREFAAGKIEALAIAPDFRGTRSARGQSLVIDLLSTLYSFAVEQGTPVLFGLAPPRVAAIHVRAGCRRATIDAPAYVLVASPRAFARTAPSRRRKAVGFAFWAAQTAATLAVEAVARVATASLRRAVLGAPAPEDASLVEVDVGNRRWTISGSDSWTWLAGSGVLRSLTVPGRFGSRALVRADDSQPSTVQIVAWAPRRGGLLPAFLLLAAAARLARRRGAPTLRFQPWNGAGGDGALARACRLLGFVRRAEADPVMFGQPAGFDADELQLTPFFYVTF